MNNNAQNVTRETGAYGGSDNRIREEKLLSPHKLTMIALFGVIAFLLMLWRFPLPFMPPFMDFDLAAVPELIGTFLLGPVEGVLIIAIKVLLKTITQGTGSAFTGELINFILSCSLVLPAWFVYKIKKDKAHARGGMVLGMLVATAVACVANIYLIIPLYARLFGFDMDAVIGMTREVNPYVDSVSKLVLLGIAPFNIIKNGVAVIISMLLYKRVMRALQSVMKRR
ncbi:MAG: ECF transporter S component [Clostridiales Family XIII bacterium]|nr:ECF transporter S component [Clostridiales Family XIII bacterium]